ncbi:unnamed protein product [Musa acuminata subsp. malaccensis]|uniref:(wild Malaysian banana) hypothetical protein n=1 Tax=Musa acuminata subsp. malaccensis TaxID=214687 RepID=A0A804IBB9_MUSAM|nr:PREDICTED: uncharacterized protein LOC103978023 isoform X1 [Musa acuminata subsp. malaccensis]CAG1849953.1 unnamed protein product [Musa acuminata subsp. malaccensis]
MAIAQTSRGARSTLLSDKTVRRAEAGVPKMVEEVAPFRSTGFTDPGWEHGVAQDEKRKKVKCNYCGKIVSGGIYRLKQHLARISGEVTYCKKAPEEVFMKMKENLEGYRSNRKRHLEDEEQSFDLHSNHDDEEEEELDYKQKGREARIARNLVTSITPLRSLGYIDPGWEHGVAQDEKKKKVKCNYCEKIVSGGINRFKQHLARIPGEVASCKMAPEEVYLKMKENMKWHRTGRRRRPETKEVAALYMHPENEDENEHANDMIKSIRTVDDHDVSTSKTIRKRSRGRSPGNGARGAEMQLKQIALDSVLSNTQKIRFPLSYKLLKQKRRSIRRSRKEVLSAICRFFYYAAIPFNAADSPYFHKMLDLVSQYGHGFKSPTSRLISGRSLQDEVQTTKEYFVEIKASWATTGCSILADSWRDVQGKTIINFLVSCPRGTYFISSVDASDVVKDATCLFKLIDKVVEEVGERNVVQVITENTACYKAAGKLLEEKRRSLFWTPCAAYCIDQILEDFTEIKWVKECLEKGQKITRFIYNHIWLLNLMKKEFTAGKEILKPAITRFLTSFLTLRCLQDHRSALKRMFHSSRWMSSQLAKSDEGKEVEKIIFNSTFWKKTHYVNKSVDPVVQMLTVVGSNCTLSMPSIYNGIYSAKLAMKAVHADSEQKYGPFWSVLDNHWNSVFHHPLYVAAYFLNPSYRYRPDFMAIPEVIRGLNECITRLEPDTGRRISAAAQISDFVYAKADFGTELALSTRIDLDPAAWWQQHGINCLELQRVAVRILSQSCTSFGCKPNWSTFDHTHATRHSRLAQKRLNDFAYVHYNLRLRERERQLKRITDESISFDNVFLERLLDNWIVSIDQPALLDDEEALYHNTEQAESYGIEINENEEFNRGSKKTSTDIALPELLETSGAHPAGVGAATDEDDTDLDFLDDDLDD